MAQMNSKQQVYAYVKTASEGFEKRDMEQLTTLQISEHLHMSRTLVSTYLNDLVKEGKVVKISTRPVYYLDKQTLEHNYHISLQEHDYVSMKEIQDYVHRNLQSNFAKAIGREGTLRLCIHQLCTAVRYPNGLPILLIGEQGTGKRFLVQCLYEYSVSQGFLQVKAPCIIYKAMKEKSEQECLEQLFGNEEKGTLGLFDQAESGILYIKNVGYLCEEVQDRLANFISNATFTRFKGSTLIKKNVRLIFSVDVKNQVLIHSEFMNKIPILCTIPSWNQRYEDERKEFILLFLKKEEQKLNKHIKISIGLIQALAQLRFHNNLNELHQMITVICADAFQAADADVNIQNQNLPSEILSEITISNGEELHYLHDLNLYDSMNTILQIWEQLFSLLEDSIEFSDLMNEAKEYLKQYYNVLLFSQIWKDSYQKVLEEKVQDILDKLQKGRAISFPLNFTYVFTRAIIMEQNHASHYYLWMQQHQKQMQDFYHLLSERLPEIEGLCEVMIHHIENHIHYQISLMNKIFMMINLNSYHQSIQQMDTLGLIICHGYATASSIADAVNEMLEIQVFEAIDMPIHSSSEEVRNRLQEFLKDHAYLKNIILMVDMGSLEELGNNLYSSIRVGMMNHVSTLLALEVGQGILQRKEIKQIMNETKKQTEIHIQLYEASKKEHAIVFTSDAGIAIAEKLSHLFKNSLPRSIPLKMVVCEFSSLHQNGKADPIFSQYQVEMVIRPMNLPMQGIENLSLEEIISSQNIASLNNVLKNYLDEHEIDAFDQRLLKNFSLQSVMENLTILNAEKLLDYVNDAVILLQQKMHCKFLSRTIVGINMHVCFLIERLVTKTAIEEYHDLQIFMDTYQEFISIVNECFTPLLKHYNVILPISEIAYLYEYIEHDVHLDIIQEDF